MTDENGYPEKRTKKLLRFGLITVALGVAIGGAVTGVLVWKNKGQLPGSVVREVSGFVVYYPKPGFNTDFKLADKSVSYSAGVLVFSMRDPIGKTITFTEEATTKSFGPSDLAGMTETNTEFGQSFVDDSNSATTGTLFSDDQTWVVLNSTSPIGSTLMQQFLQSLSPVTK